jgi:hypothetical protein
LHVIVVNFSLYFFQALVFVFGTLARVKIAKSASVRLESLLEAGIETEVIETDEVCTL